VYGRMSRLAGDVDLVRFASGCKAAKPLIPVSDCAVPASDLRSMRSLSIGTIHSWLKIGRPLQVFWNESLQIMNQVGCTIILCTICQLHIHFFRLQTTSHIMISSMRILGEVPQLCLRFYSTASHSAGEERNASHLPGAFIMT
jgi:hypothetical protein